MQNEIIGTVFSVLAYVAGYAVYRSEARRRGFNPQQMSEVALWGLMTGVVCAFLAQVLLGKELWTTGMPLPGRTILGGVLGGWVGVMLAKRRLGITQSTGSLWALAIPAGEAVGRIGCYFHGCCYGTVCNLPWAVHQHDAWRHPTQIYSAIAASIAFIILWRLRDHRHLFSISLSLFAISRLMIEPLRESAAGNVVIVYLGCLWILVLAAITGVRKEHAFKMETDS